MTSSFDCPGWDDSTVVVVGVTRNEEPDAEGGHPLNCDPDYAKGYEVTATIVDPP